MQKFINRRQFLQKSGGLLALAPLLKSGLFAQVDDFSGTVPVPGVSPATEYRAQASQWEILRNQPTDVWGFLPKTFAPPLVADQDETLDLTLYNQLASETLGLHWHGIRLPNAMDGVPKLTQDPITLGKNYRYRFTAPDAGTYWYHTHSHSLTQMRMGLVAPLIIKEKKPYPVDQDLIVLMNDWSLDRDMRMDRKLMKDGFKSHTTLAHGGLLGNIITVNGKVNPIMTAAPNSRLRLRFINAATARIFYLDIPKELNPHFLALDGNPIPVERYRKIALAPGMRMDVIVDLPSRPENFQIDEDAYQKRENLFRLEGQGKPIRSRALSRPKPLPQNPIPKINPNSAQRIEVSLGGGAMSMLMMKGMVSGLFWTINGVSMSEEDHYKKPIFQIKKNRDVILSLKNETAFAHPIHLHGHTFFILSRDGTRAANPRATDTIFLEAQEKAEIGFKADNPGKWMMHCHVIDHQVSGMMGFFEVG